MIGYFDKFDISDWHTEFPPYITAPTIICTIGDAEAEADYIRKEDHFNGRCLPDCEFCNDK